MDFGTFIVQIREDSSPSSFPAFSRYTHFMHVQEAQKWLWEALEKAKTYILVFFKLGEASSKKQIVFSQAPDQ